MIERFVLSETCGCGAKAHCESSAREWVENQLAHWREHHRCSLSPTRITRIPVEAPA